MWKTTLMVVSADNGGAQYFSYIGYHLWGSGNNLPLRGGKTSDWEGGIRVNSFATGGLLAGSLLLGKSTESLMQFADWYGTFCFLAGIDQRDEVAIANKLPDVDSINQWPALWSYAKPRDEIHVSPTTLISHGGKWKLLTGPDPGSINQQTTDGFVPFNDWAVGYYNDALMQGTPAGPADQPGLVAKGGIAATCVREGNKELLAGPGSLGFSVGLLTCPAPGQNCTKGCLFNLDEDPAEQYDVADKYPRILAEMWDKLKAYETKWTPDNPTGIFNPIRNGNNPNCAPGGKYEAECGADYCSDEEAAYDPSCASAKNGWCLVCAPGNAGCDHSEKIHLKGCTSRETCHHFTHETGFYSWVAPSAGP